MEIQPFLAFICMGKSIRIHLGLSMLSKIVLLYLRPCQIRPNKKISVFWVTGLKILGRGRRTIFFSGKI